MRRPDIAGWSSLVARRAHNPEVVGSNPAPATINLQLGTVISVPSFFLFDTRGCTFRCTYTTSAAAGRATRRPPIHSVAGSIVSRGGSPSRRMAADGARGADPAGVDRRAPRHAALGTEPPHLALVHGAVAHVLEKEGRVRAPCDGTLRRERRARAPVC